MVEARKRPTVVKRSAVWTGAVVLLLAWFVAVTPFAAYALLDGHFSNIPAARTAGTWIMDYCFFGYRSSGVIGGRQYAEYFVGAGIGVTNGCIPTPCSPRPLTR